MVVAGPTGYRKLKYMWALASGVPLLHTGWVDACIAEQRRLPFFGQLEEEGGRGGRGNYALPAGLSLLEERFIFRPPSPTGRARPDPLLKGKCVVFCCSDASFGREWKAVFRAAGAREAVSVREIDGEWLRGHNVDYLVGDHSWPKQQQQQFHEQPQGGGVGGGNGGSEGRREGMELALVKTLLLRGQARLVSFDYVVQCFVHGRMLGRGENARFELNWRVDMGTGELKQGEGREGGREERRVYHIRVGIEGGPVKRYEEGDFVVLRDGGTVSPRGEGGGGGRREEGVASEADWICRGGSIDTAGCWCGWRKRRRRGRVCKAETDSDEPAGGGGIFQAA